VTDFNPVAAAAHPNRLRIITEALQERLNQDRKWGLQNHPDGTGATADKTRSTKSRTAADKAAADGTLTWKHILQEEVDEAFAETDDGTSALRTELLQVAAVALAWVEALDRRTGIHDAALANIHIVE